LTYICRLGINKPSTASADNTAAAILLMATAVCARRSIPLLGEEKIMKEILAYLLLLFGMPIAAGSIVSLLLCILLELVIGETWKKIPDAIDNIIDGILSMIFSLLLFKLLGLEIKIFIPIILIAVTIYWLSTRKEYRAIPWQIVGIIIVWLTNLSS
jgi:hypothetical protein